MAPVNWRCKGTTKFETKKSLFRHGSPSISGRAEEETPGQLVESPPLFGSSQSAERKKRITKKSNRFIVE